MSEAENQNEGSAEAAVKPAPITFAEFLESTSPSQLVRATDVWRTKTDMGQIWDELKSPDLLLHCTSDTCNGLRFFRYHEGSKTFANRGTYIQTFLTYRCSNCRRVAKLYSVSVIRQDDESGNCYKYGEMPPYGPPTPARLIRLFGEDREIFSREGSARTTD